MTLKSPEKGSSSFLSVSRPMTEYTIHVGIFWFKHWVKEPHQPSGLNNFEPKHFHADICNVWLSITRFGCSVSLTHAPPSNRAICCGYHAIVITWYHCYCSMVCSVGIYLKELGGQLPKCLKFCPGIEVYGRFSLKMSVRWHERGGV